MTKEILSEPRKFESSATPEKPVAPKPKTAVAPRPASSGSSAPAALDLNTLIPIKRKEK